MSSNAPSRPTARKASAIALALQAASPIDKWPTRRITGHRGMVTTMAWSHNGQNLATGSHDKTVRCYNPERADATMTDLRAHTGNVNTVSFSPTNAQFLASGSADKTVKFWDLRQSKPVGSINIERTPLYMAFRPGHDEVVIGDEEDQLQFLDFKTFKINRIWNEKPGDKDASKEPRTQVNEFRFAPSGRALIVAHGDQRASIYEYDTMKEVHELLCHTGRYICMDLDPSGRYLAIGAADAIVSIWDTRNWICVTTFADFEQAVTNVSLSFDGKYCAATSEQENRFEIFFTATGKTAHTLSDNAQTQCLAWCPTKPYLAYSRKGTSEGAIQILGLDR